MIRGFLVFVMLVAGVLPVWGQVKGELVASVEQAKAGGDFVVGLRLMHEKGWHTYWKNPGVGMATKIEVELPEGWKAGEILWPTPELIRGRDGEVTGMGYSGEVMLPMKVKVPLGVKGDFVLKAKASWLMCEEVCVPGGGEFEVRVKAGDKQIPEYAEYKWHQMGDPGEGEPATQMLEWRLWAIGHSGWVELRIMRDKGGESGRGLSGLRFFPEDEAVDFAGKQEFTKLGSQDYRLSIPLVKGAEMPSILRGVLKNDRIWWRLDGPRGWAVEVPIEKEGGKIDFSVVKWAQVGEEVEVPSGIFGVLGLAFLGGVILNLMPCVFPVLGLKVLGLAGQAGISRREGIGNGLVFLLGVLVSFWVLTGVLWGLRAGGEELGWGFQLQSPVFVFVLAAVLLGVGLNLSGVFEVGLGASGVGAGLMGRRGLSGAFFTGVLTVVVATPCSAPFLATAIGAAFVLGNAGAFAVFTAVGLGLAAPVVVLSCFPKLLGKLPRGGEWMVGLRQGLAFLIYASFGFLVWVLAGQVTGELLLSAIFGFAVMAFGGWVFGRRKSWRGAVVAGVILLMGIWMGWPTGGDAGGLKWEDWSRERVEELRKEGRTVYVDFTARWCATCVANKRVVFGSEELRRVFAEKKVVLLKADWTNGDERISEELARWGRRAVPMTLVYAKGGEGVVLPEVLTPGVVLEAVGR